MTMNGNALKILSVVWVIPLTPEFDVRMAIWIILVAWIPLNVFQWSVFALTCRGMLRD